MSYDHRVVLQFQKNLSKDSNHSIQYEAYSKKRVQGVPAKSVLLNIEDLSYIEKLGSWKSRLPYSDIFFNGKSVELCIHPAGMEYCFGEKEESKYLYVPDSRDGNPITVFWNVEDSEYISMIQNSLATFTLLRITATLDVRDSHFKNLSCESTHEFEISNLKVDFHMVEFESWSTATG